MKTIWFVSHYSMPPQFEMRIKTQMYAHHLSENGHQALIFSSSALHNTDINLIKDKRLYVEEKYGDLNFVHIRCSQYRGNGLRRIYNMQEFAIKFPKVAKNFKKPDVIIADVNCTNYYPIYRFCKRNNIPFYIDMRDLWPMSIVEYSEGFKDDSLIIKFLYRLERKMFQRANGIVFSMPGGYDYVLDKNMRNVPKEKCHYINNGVDLEEFDRQVESCKYSNESYDSDKSFKFVYTGSIREANNVEQLIHGMEKLQEAGEDSISLFLFGNGDDVPRLKSYCKERNLKNVHFMGRVEKTEIPSILSKADACILNYRKSKTLKYGGSQNKLFEYLAAGKPVLMTVDMNYNIVTEHDCGVALESPDPELIAGGMMQISKYSSHQLARIRDSGRKLVQEYDFRKLTEKLMKVIGMED